MRIGKIKSKHILKELRFSGGYFLNEDAVNSRLLEENADKCKPLKELANVFNPPIFKRQFCENTERAVPYCQSSDVTNALEGSDVHINKAQAIKVGAVVKDKQTLVTGFGTIGNTRLVNELSDGIAYANNVCRIETHYESNYGYIYALMTSKYGRAQLNKNASGSVVRYIESPGIKETLVPILPEAKQQQIHNLIVEASKLRVEANTLLKEAHNKIEEKINFKPKQSRVSQKVSINTIFDAHQKRYEAQYYVSEGYEVKEHIKESEFKYLRDVCKPVFRPGIFKRHYVDTGLEFLGGSDIVRAIPKSDKKLSIAKTKHLNELKIKEDWILVTCGGTIGYSVLVDRYLADKTASQHILRVIADDIKSGYLFAFMSSSIGLKAIQSFTYGSVIPQIEPHHLELLPIPILDEKLMDEIHNMMMKYKENISTAIENELEAINLIENEIEQWQTS